MQLAALFSQDGSLLFISEHCKPPLLFRKHGFPKGFHGVCFLPFFFCVQFDLDAVSFWGVWFKIWLVLHEALEELVGGFGGEEGHGKQLLSGE
jgi:hypothetical protein